MSKWQDLTEEELYEVAKDYGPLSYGEWNLMLLTQQALREKNTNSKTTPALNEQISEEL